MRYAALFLFLIVPLWALAQWQKGPPDNVSVNGTVDTNITSSVRLDVSASTEPGVCLPVAGSSDCLSRLEVSVPGAITLDSSASAMLAGQRNCAYQSLGRLTTTPDGGVFHIPSGPTGATFKAHSFGNNVDYVSCWVHNGLGPFPNCAMGDGGVGFDLHDHETQDVDLATNQTWKLDCLTCVHAGSPTQNNAVVTGIVSTCTPPP